MRNFWWRWTNNPSSWTIKKPLYHRKGFLYPQYGPIGSPGAFKPLNYRKNGNGYSWKQKSPLRNRGPCYAIAETYSAATCFVSLLFKLAALLEWMIFLLAKRSIILTTLGNKASASFLFSSERNFLMALRVVLCWYLLRRRTASFLLILFNADLWFAIFFFLLLSRPLCQIL